MSSAAPSPSASSAALPDDAAPAVFLRGVRLPHGGHPTMARLSGGRVGLGQALRPEPGDLVIEAEGRWLIPGLWDAHVHLDQWAQTRGRLDLTDAGSPEEAVRRVAAALAAEG